MRKSELIQRLSSVPGDPEVVLTQNSEGRDFAVCDDVTHERKEIARRDGLYQRKLTTEAVVVLWSV